MSQTDRRDAYKRFMNALQTSIGDAKTIIAVDECGFDNRLIPQYGYGKRGTRLRIKNASARSWKRTHMIASVTNYGDVRYVLHESAIYADLFAMFVSSLPYPPGSVLLLDNVRFHHSYAVVAAIKLKGYEALYTPPYCPDANPIEHLFGTVKHHFRQSWGARIIQNTDDNDHTDFTNILEDTMCAVSMIVDGTALFGATISWLGMQTAFKDNTIS
jgi:hypothetical protein